ncbi:MAG TPA: Asp-tRNA(Asn)/Glu-tRNA(Gln) amidotransferase subunit GatC [Candidatus Methanoperedenaceae archaeon]|nr:Asp-tRNA(Asn)/Glu-tRNA(Gln) amidotransferase subunit GatC [Candidatus Methanoperedenaceae archaeon]
MISKKDIEHVGWLARIELSEEDKERYAPVLNSILGYFEKLDEIETDAEPMYHVLPLSNIFREDITTGCLSQEEALSNAPKKQDGYFRVPRMM